MDIRCPGAVVHNAGNPIGEAIVWWNQVITDEDQIGIFIRCFRAGRRAYEHQTKVVTSTSRPPVLDDERSRLL